MRNSFKPGWPRTSEADLIQELLAQAEADLEQARRRHEIAQALAADWLYWAPC